jgi:copper chaperone CopZ
MDDITLGVDGMTCSGCVRSVEKAIERVPGVTAVKVSLEKKEAHVSGTNLNPDVLRAVVEDAGYEVRA